MLSAYSWSQFGVFTLILVSIYYLGVGVLYYRAELTALLTPGAKGARGQLVGAGGRAAAPPALVRPTSAFGQAKPAAAKSERGAEEGEEGPAAGADQNLPTAVAPLVGGELPSSTGTATGQDESTGETTPMAAAAASDKAQAQDGTRTEAADQADEHLAALVRREAANLAPAQEQSTETAEALEPEPVHQAVPVDGYEPLATFDEPVASPLDIVPAQPVRLVAAASVAEYLALLQAGQRPAPPVELAGTSLAEQMAQQLALNNAELDDLFGPDDE